MSDKFKIGSKWSFDGFFENPITFEIIRNNWHVVRFKQLSGTCIDVVQGKMVGCFSEGSTMYRDSLPIT